MRTTSFYLATIAVFFMVCSSFAEESFQNLGVLVVHDSSEINTPKDYIEISSDAFEGKYFSAADLLSEFAGIQSYRQGGFGSFESVSVRGISAKNILICLDGIPLNDASGGAFDLSRIDLNQIEKIEIYKNRIPAKFGGQGLGGVIHFISKKSIENQSQIGLTYGSHQFFSGNATVSVALKDSVQLKASLSVRHSDNDYEFLNRNGTEYNTEDDFKDKRENAEWTDFSANVFLRILHPDAYFSSLSFKTRYAFGGNPGREDFRTKVADFQGFSNTIQYALESPGYFDFLYLTPSLSFYFDKNLASSYYPLDHIGYVSSEYLEYGMAEYKIIPEIRAEFLPEESSRFKNLKGSFRIAYEKDIAKPRGDSKEFSLKRNTISLSSDIYFKFISFLSLGGEASVNLSEDEVESGVFVLPTGILNLDEDDKWKASFSGRAFTQFDFSYALLEFSAGRFFKQPALMELYGVFPGSISNPDLKEETALKYEASLIFPKLFRHTSLKTACFESYLENGIYWITSASFMKAENVGKAEIFGVELELDSKPVSFLEILLHTTIQKTKDKSGVSAYKNNPLPLEPELNLFTALKVHLPYQFSVQFVAKYRSEIFSDRAKKIKQPGVSNYDLALEYRPFEKTKLIFCVENLTNENYRSVYTPYPMPGREYKFSIIQKI